MTGRLDEPTREQLVNLMVGITSLDSEQLVDTFLEMGVIRRRVDRFELRLELEHLVSRYYGRELGEINITALLNDSLGVIRRHRLQLPSSLALLVKAVVMNEGLGLQLDPGFNLATVLAPYAQGLVLRQLSPVRWARRLGRASLDIADLVTVLPRQIRRIVGDIERTGLEVSLRPDSFEPILKRLERIANRIVLGIIAAAFINGLAVLLSVSRPPGWQQRVEVLFSIGFVAAAALGVYLAWTILRSGRG
jgi:ubiquinone biosynthesis protein